MSRRLWPVAGYVLHRMYVVNANAGSHNLEADDITMHPSMGDLACCPND